MASACASHDALTGYTPAAHDLAFLDASQRAPAVRGLLYKDRRERPQRDTAHVHWDEQCIAEHDKERGTRQKIDEPDTPFIRSPESSSEEEEAFAPSTSTSSSKRHEELVDDETRIATSPTSMAALANRLNQWVESGERRESFQSAEGEVTSREGEASRPGTKSVPSKIRLPEDEGQQKASTSEFKARRAKHYNEFAAVKALRKKEADSDSSVDSDTSDEEAAAKKERRAQKARATSAEDGQKGRSDGITSGAGKREGDSEEASSGLPGEEREASFVHRSRALPNPMEGGRPPVQFGEDAPAGTSSPSSEFLAQRRAHYDEAAALRSKHLEDGASPGGLSDMDKSAAANPMDPTEPQEAAVSFKVETLSGDHQGSGTDAWRSKRNAHYRDMAAAFRSKPPVSDGDSEDDSS
eukprot:s4931_g6.t1